MIDTTSEKLIHKAVNFFICLYFSFSGQFKYHAHLGTSSLYLNEMIAKQIRALSTAQQNKDKTQNPQILGATINNESTATEPPP